jgi:hypothetical protein
LFAPAAGGLEAELPVRRASCAGTPAWPTSIGSVAPAATDVTALLPAGVVTTVPPRSFGKAPVVPFDEQPSNEANTMITTAIALR